MHYIDYSQIDVPATVRAVLAELQRKPAWQFLCREMERAERPEYHQQANPAASVGAAHAQLQQPCFRPSR